MARLLNALARCTELLADYEDAEGEEGDPGSSRVSIHCRPSERQTRRSESSSGSSGRSKAPPAALCRISSRGGAGATFNPTRRNTPTATVERQGKGLHCRAAEIYASVRLVKTPL